MSEIQDLAARLQTLDRTVNFWNSLYIAAVLGTVIAAALSFFFQFVSMRRVSERDVVNKRLMKLKDDQSALDIANAGSDAARANVRAGILEKEAAVLTATNLRLEAAIAPRRLSDRQQKGLAALTQFAGRTVGVKSYSSDTEGLILATQILDALTTAKLQIEDNRLTMQPAGSVSFGVSVEGTDDKLVEELRRILSLDGTLTNTSSVASPNRAGVAFSIGLGVITGGKPPAATVTVGPKPIK